MNSVGKYLTDDWGLNICGVDNDASAQWNKINSQAWIQDSIVQDEDQNSESSKTKNKTSKIRSWDVCKLQMVKMLKKTYKTSK